MKLILSLSKDKQLWALSNPEENRSYISYGKEKGVQETILIFTSRDRGPKTVELEDYPDWAKRMILSSVITGELLNDGDPVGKEKAEKVVETIEPKTTTKVKVEEIKTTSKQPKSKGKTRSKKG